MKVLQLVLALIFVCVACGPERRSGGRDNKRNEPVDAGHELPPDGGDVDPSDAGGNPDAGEVDPPDAGEEESDGGENPTNVAPIATLATPAASAGDVLIRTNLFDSDGDRLNVAFEWSLNGGPFSPATTSSSLSNLEATSSGVEHSFVWRSAVDLPDATASVRVRVTPSDEWATGQAATSNPFSVDNRRPNVAPSARWTTPGAVRGDAVFTFTAIDGDSDPVTAALQYRVGAGSWMTPTLVAPLPASISASPGGVTVSFTWRSAADVTTNEANVAMRVQLSDGRTASAWVETPSFAVNNAPFTREAGVRFVEINAGGTSTSDWVDLTNFSAQTVDLRGWMLEWSNAGDQGTVTIPSSGVGSLFTLTPGETVTATDETPGSATGTIYFGEGANVGWIAGDAGHATLYDSQGTAIDFVRWGGSTQAPPEGLIWSEPRPVHLRSEAMSIVRKPGMDTLSSADFCVASWQQGPVQNACLEGAPAGARVRLTEISSGTGDSNTTTPADWVELVNDSNFPVNLAGWVLQTADTAGTHEYAFEDLALSSGARLVLRGATGTSSSTTLNVGEDLGVSNTGIAVLYDPVGEPQDYVRWGGSGDVPPAPIVWPSGASAPGVRYGFSTISRTSESFSTPVSDSAASKWCVTNASRGSFAFAGCLPPPNIEGLRISEIEHTFFDVFGFQNHSGSVELENTSDRSIDLEGFVLFLGGAGEMFGDVTISPHGRVVVANCGVIDQPEGCMSFFVTVLSGFPTPASAELVDYTGRSVDFVRWGGSTRTPSTGGFWSGDTPTPGNNESLGRKTGTSDTDSGSDWCLQASSPGNGNGACH